MTYSGSSGGSCRSWRTAHHGSQDTASEGALLPLRLWLGSGSSQGTVIEKLPEFAWLAQLVDHETLNLRVQALSSWVQAPGWAQLLASLIAQVVKNPPAMQETWVRSLGWEDPLEKGKATHSNILA